MREPGSRRHPGRLEPAHRRARATTHTTPVGCEAPCEGGAPGVAPLCWGGTRDSRGAGARGAAVREPCGRRHPGRLEPAHRRARATTTTTPAGCEPPLSRGALASLYGCAGGQALPRGRGGPPGGRAWTRQTTLPDRLPARRTAPRGKAAAGRADRTGPVRGCARSARRSCRGGGTSAAAGGGPRGGAVGRAGVPAPRGIQRGPPLPGGKPPGLGRCACCPPREGAVTCAPSSWVSSSGTGRRGARGAERRGAQGGPRPGASSAPHRTAR